MEIDEHTIRKIEALTGVNIRLYNRVAALHDASSDALNLAARLALIDGGSIPAIQFLRHISQCTLAEAIDALNNAQQPDGE